ncbi:sprT-like domain-containing protein Spartan-like [Scleropages formosus]|uniref:DNA-dependent metalloprotease SPRTN n=1 Tax=Scleropages formosus TaxID=113540 RepID=A0A0P7UHJ1_SCLFO|nr:sprT-like domain-containing protein Spartan-like [Scleropages formosus]
MMMDEDFLLALQLQEQFDQEASASSSSSSEHSSNKKRRVAPDEARIIPYAGGGSLHPERPLSIVDESWELLDPNPDVRAMFLAFNDMFFWGKLSGVETLLHEMIHALLFVTQNNRDRDGHGPEFCKHMDRINKASGTNITVCHTFHDEVDLYRQHWWRCNGPCQNLKPFFGYVKRAMNRAPSAQDPWWADHQRSCGGTYIKIKEPENYGKKDKKDHNKDTKGHTQPANRSKSGLQDIRNVLPFSGKGFVLGGNPRPASPEKQPELSNARLPSSMFSGKNHNGPGQASPGKIGGQATVSSGSSGPQNLPKRPNSLNKKSVSNTKAFVNINGSPVRISGTLNTNFSRVKQKSFSDLFSPGGAKSAPWAGQSCISSSASTSTSFKTTGPSYAEKDGGASADLRDTAFTSNSVNLGRAHSNHSSNPADSRPGSGFHSEQIRSPKKPSSTLPISKKRPWEGITSTNICDFFKRKTGVSSGVVDTRETPAPAATCSFSQPALQAAPADTTDPRVRCPVCQIPVPESKINEHLDSCLT